MWEGYGELRCLQVFVDSDFVSKATDSRSMSDHVVMRAGARVPFSSKAGQRVALSPTEAAYVALADGTKEAIFLR